MEHRSFGDLQRLADVYSVRPAESPYSVRLTRWADVLDEDGNRELRLFVGTEFSEQRDAWRLDDSPLSVAFADPLLRAYGLVGDSYGAARHFFGVSNTTLHEIVCYCHYSSNAVVQARQVSSQIRKAAARVQRRERLARVFRLAGVGTYRLLLRGLR
jgi:hypothetical protein